MTRKSFLRDRQVGIALILFAAIVIFGSAFLPPASSISANLCAPCHSQYSEYLDILEGDSRNQLPTSIGVGETKNVTVVLENRANTVTNAVMSSVSLTLRSKNGHFSVKQEGFTVQGLFQWGTTKIAAWQITGVSLGADALLISATSTNVHESLRFSDSYSPEPTITVSEPTVPEFPTLTVFAVLMVMTVLLAVFFRKRLA